MNTNKILLSVFFVCAFAAACVNPGTDPVAPSVSDEATMSRDQDSLYKLKFYDKRELTYGENAIINQLEQELGDQLRRSTQGFPLEAEIPPGITPVKGVIWEKGGPPGDPNDDPGNLLFNWSLENSCECRLENPKDPDHRTRPYTQTIVRLNGQVIRALETRLNVATGFHEFWTDETCEQAIDPANAPDEGYGACKPLEGRHQKAREFCGCEATVINCPGEEGWLTFAYVLKYYYDYIDLKKLPKVQLAQDTGFVVDPGTNKAFLWDWYTMSPQDAMLACYKELETNEDCKNPVFD